MELETAKATAQAESARRGGLNDLGNLLRDLIDTIETLSDSELGFLNGVVAGTGAASKALVLDSSGKIVLPGELDASGNTSGAKGAGITGAAHVHRSSVMKVGGIIYTDILLDLTDLVGSATDLDIIGGAAGAASSHLGQIVAALNGTILGGYMQCLEVPAGGADDLDLYSATVATGAQDGLVTDLTETVLITSGAAWTNGLIRAFSGVPPANDYIYIVNGEAVGGTFTAGKFLIRLFGYDA
jgi:hypothetical protein